MLSEEATTALAEPVAKRFESVNGLTLRLIAERIKAIGELLPSDAHKLKQLKDYGADMARIEQALAEATGKGVDDIHRITKPCSLVPDDFPTLYPCWEMGDVCSRRQTTWSHGKIPMLLRSLHRKPSLSVPRSRIFCRLPSLRKLHCNRR